MWPKHKANISASGQIVTDLLSMQNSGNEYRHLNPLFLFTTQKSLNEGHMNNGHFTVMRSENVLFLVC